MVAKVFLLYLLHGFPYFMGSLRTVHVHLHQRLLEVVSYEHSKNMQCVVLARIGV